MDIANDMAEGTQSLTCSQLTIDRLTVTPLRNATANLNIISGMHGTYRIGASESADFATIQAAVDALIIGIDGAVTFQIENGVYNECVKIPDLMGLSAAGNLRCGEAIDYITMDILGRKRAALPMLGAYEYVTDPSTGLETSGEIVPVRKVLYNGTMLIISNGKAYNALSVQVGSFDALKC